MEPATPIPKLQLDLLPGHQIRRLQQIAVGLFMEHTAGLDLTPVQFAALATVAQQPDIDQRTLAAHIGFDTSTIGGVIDRLERRALMQRHAAPGDRRVRQLSLTAAGMSLLQRAIPCVHATQQDMLAPLSAAEQSQFMTLLDRLVHANNDASRAPSDAT